MKSQEKKEKLQKWLPSIAGLSLAIFGGATSANSNANEDITCLSKNIYYEARDQSREGQYAVAMVTLNRVYSDLFPNTVCEVVYPSTN